MNALEQQDFTFVLKMLKLLFMHVGANLIIVSNVTKWCTWYFGRSRDVSEYEKVLLFLILDCLGTSFENERSMVNLYLVDVLYKYRSDLDFDVLMHCDELTIPNQVRDWVVIQERERR